jgi:hypothetical protein
VLEWPNELRRAGQGWSPGDIYCFQRYRYLKMVRRGKLKPETEAKRLLATLPPHDRRNEALSSCGMKIAATAIALAPAGDTQHQARASAHALGGVEKRQM